MRRNEKGFTFVELIISLGIIALVGSATGMAIFQVFKGTERNGDQLNLVNQVQNVGYWVGRDARMAETINTDNLTPPDFLEMEWTEWDSDGDPTYYEVTYYFEELADGMGRLKRNYWSSAGANEDTRIAERIYYVPSDTDNTTRTSYQPPSLTLRVTSRFEDEIETREYLVSRRPDI